MTLYRHELKMNRLSFMIWLLSVAAMSCACIFLFPMMEDSMGDLSDAFAAMGGFSSAFGMDKLPIATLEGFFGTEIGTIYALGGGMYAALLGIAALSKEETNHTAEFLHTLTLGRCEIPTSKLLAIFTLLTAFGLINWGAFVGSAAIIGESIKAESLCSYMLAQYLCQLEIASVCFALSAATKRSGLGVGLGLALILYVLDLVSRVAEQVEFLKTITPFGYSNATDIFVSEGKIEAIPAAIGIGVTVISLAAAYVVYNKRDIAA